MIYLEEDDTIWFIEINSKNKKINVQIGYIINEPYFKKYDKIYLGVSNSAWNINDDIKNYDKNYGLSLALYRAFNNTYLALKALIGDDRAQELIVILIKKLKIKLPQFNDTIIQKVINDIENFDLRKI